MQQRGIQHGLEMDEFLDVAADAFEENMTIDDFLRKGIEEDLSSNHSDDEDYEP